MKKIIIMCGIITFFNSVIFSQDLKVGKFSAQVFADYFYNVSRDSNFSSLNNTATEGMQDLNGFVLRRASLNYDMDISKKFSARFRIEADSKSNTTNNRIGVFIKDAYLKWNDIFEGSSLLIGIQPTPSFTISEKHWGYRSLEKTIQDLRGFVPSRDFGLALMGQLSESNKFNYVVMFGNNSANSPENDKYKRYYASVDFSPLKNFTVALTGDFKSRASIDDPNNANEKLANNSILGSLFLGYSEKENFTLGLETVMQINQNSWQSSNLSGPVEVKNINSLGLSVFGSIWITESIAPLLRYDFFDSNIDGDSKSDSRNYILAGIDFKMDKSVSIIPNIIYESYENTPTGVSIDPSLTARVTFYFNF